MKVNFFYTVSVSTLFPSIKRHFSNSGGFLVMSFYTIYYTIVDYDYSNVTFYFNLLCYKICLQP